MISVITCTNRNTFRNNIIENYTRQKWKDKELIIILNNDSLNIKEWEAHFEYENHVTIKQMKESYTLGECLNSGIQLAQHDYIAKMDDDDYYSREYLNGSYEALMKSKAKVVGKTSIYMYFEEDQSLQLFNPYKFAPMKIQHSESMYNPKVLMGGTLLFEKKVNDIVPFQSSSLGEDAKFCEDCIDKKITIYSGKKDHYVYIRRLQNEHTWNIQNEQLRRFCSLITRTDDFQTYLSTQTNE
ncbi:glycosyltransferase [Pseudalkalibacillus berkeleyi]|uniref:Glycosyltransferase family 2 protein n=1 Tax=Pseudalkalibacillus berkeleyi TaxID=1069813 RepID=A0ABS9GZG7_9BACL|nr:glycosyltransferase [Pseudalkalibacillus berkeleyi]MCF6136883.1 glycosyltransferase family 2 protein [Pseudalkalibacillus berkeleyi]